jgi:hypothetical protein
LARGTGTVLDDERAAGLRVDVPAPAAGCRASSADFALLQLPADGTVGWSPALPSASTGAARAIAASTTVALTNAFVPDWTVTIALPQNLPST